MKTIKGSYIISNAVEHVQQIKEIGLVDASDLEIWNYAYKNDFVIVTFDSDFVDLANLKGSPLKIIWIRFGNSSNLHIANKLISNAGTIEEFIFNLA